MRAFVLTLLIVTNIVGGVEAAYDFSSAWANFGAIASADANQPHAGDHANSHAGDHANDPQGAVDCSHCSHCSAHFMGFVGAIHSLAVTRLRDCTPFTDFAYQIAGRAPPTPPPNV